jgi:hypothetical protein
MGMEHLSVERAKSTRGLIGRGRLLACGVSL